MRFHYITYVLIIPVCLTLSSTSANAQSVNDSKLSEWKDYFDKSYGPDYSLINGVQYAFLYSDVEGHPFFGEDKFHKGSLVLNKKEYQEVYLKYDLYNQNLILQFELYSGGKDQILLKKKNIEEFRIDGKLFRKYSFPEKGTRYYQVVSKGDIFCLYFWKKHLDHSTLNSTYHFTKQTKKSYLVKNNKAYIFRGRRKFRKIFPGEYSRDIRKYFRKNDIRIRREPDGRMQDLLEFCNQLIEKR